MRKPAIVVTRTETPQSSGKPLVHLLLVSGGYSILVRCPPLSSCAFVDGWTLPDPRAKDHGLLDAMVERMLSLVRSERVCVKMLVESRDSMMVHVLQWHGFKSNTRFGMKVEMLNDFTDTDRR